MPQLLSCSFALLVDVRFAPKATELVRRNELPLCASSGRVQMQQHAVCGTRGYSITSSARASRMRQNVSGQVGSGENADEVAQALYQESRGEKHDHFDGPILYRDPPVY
jgi:hypothetical protein